MTKSLPAIAMVAAVMGIIALASPVPAQAECIIIGCQTECWPIPGGRRCHRWCQRRCYQPTPQYVPPPTYHAPEYVEQPRQYARHPLPAEDMAVLLGILFLFLLPFLAAFEGSGKVNEVNKATDAALRGAGDARQLTHRGAATAEEIDRYIDAALKEAYERGRAGEDQHG
jgi:hypothetical protein